MSVLLPYHIAFGIETTLICNGNAFTIFVFWNHRHSLRRASSLLINLAVVDFLVGARELIDTLANCNDRMMFDQGYLPSVISAILFSSVSLFSLLVISLERACAVIWPFRHRVARLRIYATSILMAGLACWVLRSNSKWTCFVWLSKSIDLFSLGSLFSHFKPRDIRWELFFCPS